MSAKAVELGEQYIPHGEVVPYSGEAEWPAPGLWVVNNGTATLIGVKHPKYRPGEDQWQDTAIYCADTVPLVSSVLAEPYAVGSGRLQGAEAELNTYDREGNPFDLYPGGTPLTIEQEEHPELLRTTYETDAGPFTDAERTYRALGRKIEDMSYTLRGHGAYFDPASAFMHAVPTRQDATPNPYVQTMVNILGDDIMKFIGNGIHEHYDAHVGNLPTISRLIRPLAPYLNVGLLAAPFAYGEKTPRMGEQLGADELLAYDGRQPQSVRYLTRYTASANGGVGVRVVHDNLEEALLHAHQQMRDGLITSPSRHIGSHADVRNRYDPPSPDNLDHPGRLELCVKDTSAMRLPTLIAYSDLVRALVDRFEKVAALGEQGLAELHTDFPGLFGPSYDKTEYAVRQLENAHQNSIAIAYDGAEAVVTDGMGNKTTVWNQFRDIIRLAQDGNPDRLSKNTLRNLHKSLSPYDTTEQAMAKHRDEQGLPSLHGYYYTGLGTPAQWMIARADAASQRPNTSEADVLRDGTQDRLRSFAAYLLRNAR
jgi:hypothetical protein